MTSTHTWNSSNNWNCIKILYNLQFRNMVIVMVKSNIDFCLCVAAETIRNPHSASKSACLEITTLTSATVRGNDYKVVVFWLLSSEFRAFRVGFFSLWVFKRVLCIKIELKVKRRKRKSLIAEGDESWIQPLSPC